MFEEHAVKILWFSIIVIPLIHLLGTKLRTLGKWVWFGKVILTLLLLLAGEIVLVDWLAESTHISDVKTGFDILWWLVPAYLMVLAIGPFISPIEERYKRFLPDALRILTAIIIYALAVLGIVIFIYELLIVALIFFILFATTIGFYLQQTWASFLVNLLRRFRIGDWVKIDEFEEGEVIDITWQDTRIKTRDECVVTIPNNVVLQSTIKDFCYPDDVYWLTTKIKIDASHTPERVKKVLLDALLAADKILKDPSPVVAVTNINKDTIEYAVSYCSDDYGDKMFVKDDVFIRMWHHLKLAEIIPAIESQKIPQTITEKSFLMQNVIEKIDIFECLSDEEKKCLTEQLRPHHFEADNIVCQQGESGDSLFFIMEGVISVYVTPEKGKIREIARLGAGNFFGEMVLLTGEMRTATITMLTDSRLVEISKADLMPFIKARPELVESMARILATRMARRSRAVKTYPYPQRFNEKECCNRYLKEMTTFFELESI
jgi:branched-chain amino acid transport system substrate-binding protein